MLDKTRADSARKELARLRSLLGGCRMGSGFQPKLLQHEIQHFPKRGYFEQKERCGDLLIETAIRRNAAV